MKLYYSPEALNDLDAVWLEVWEASRDYDTADRYIQDLRETVRNRCRYPKSGTPLTYMGEFTGIYYISFKRYLSFYRINNQVIEISRILFAGSDYLKTLFGESEFTPEDTEAL